MKYVFVQSSDDCRPHLFSAGYLCLRPSIYPTGPQCKIVPVVDWSTPIRWFLGSLSSVGVSMGKLAVRYDDAGLCCKWGGIGQSRCRLKLFLSALRLTGVALEFGKDPVQWVSSYQ